MPAVKQNSCRNFAITQCGGIIMGLLKAAKDSISTLLADQWREYFYCETLPNDVLMRKGQKKVVEGRNSNTKASDNIISNGSIVAVNEGQ